MSPKHLDILTRAATFSAYLQTQQDVEKSHTTAAKLKGAALREHLIKNADLIRKELKKQYKKTKGKQKTKLLQKWKKFFEDNKHQWPDYLDYIQIRAKEIAS